MAKVITFSRVFPSYHPKAGQPTYFIEKIWTSLNYVAGSDYYKGLPDHEILHSARGHYYENDDLTPKYHTIRAGHRWKVGDWFSPRVWSGKPYNSKQIQFAPNIQIKKVWDFRILQLPSMNLYALQFFINGILVEDGVQEFVFKLSKNDGLSEDDFIEWFMDGFNKSKTFIGQIICWNESIDY